MLLPLLTHPDAAAAAASSFSNPPTREPQLVRDLFNWRRPNTTDVRSTTCDITMKTTAPRMDNDLETVDGTSPKPTTKQGRARKEPTASVPRRQTRRELRRYPEANLSFISLRDIL
ncbi:hypothetical protein CGGC5_v012670 [Colletotrichum fructicola Nara gc5]|uniref:Uncharacterized protein n=1 Tax=Colletotrichum fructicola (strain Nara gc5) TaxID=1213859 RepID=A0A7J6IQH4_COLFN|nr:hypothetical protein CGGC5_v012670 [Colletotrichum fructicola Nara gc5]